MAESRINWVHVSYLPNTLLVGSLWLTNLSRTVPIRVTPSSCPRQI